jgi:putative peptidoglycan lipid II flippase
LWRQGHRFRWRIDFADAGLRRVWSLMWPSVIAGAAVQVNVLINGVFASEINGARSWLSCAFRLMQFPIGVFGVAIATVTLPAVSLHHVRDDLREFGRTVEESLRLAFFLTIPASVGLFALAPEIIGLIYEHGRFSAADTARTAAALRAYAIGLAGYSGIKVLAPCFYALDQPKTPLRVSALGIMLNLAMNFLFVKGLGWGHVGLAASTGSLALINFAQLAFFMRRHVAYGTRRLWVRFILSVAVAAALCGAAAVGAARGVQAYADLMPLCRLLSVVAGVAAGGLAYAAAAGVLRIPEMGALLRLTKAAVRP